jgi:hypothetical protein
MCAQAAVDLAMARADQQREFVARLKRHGLKADSGEAQLEVLLQCLEAMRDHLQRLRHDTADRGVAPASLRGAPTVTADRT